MSGSDLRVQNALLNAATIAAVLLASHAVWRQYAFDDTVPVYFHATETLNSPVPQGGKVQVRIYRDKFRDDCPVLSNRTAQLFPNGRVYDIENQSSMGGPANTEFVDWEYNVSELPPGDYVLFVELTYQCPGFLHTVEQPPTFFQIVSDD